MYHAAVFPHMVVQVGQQGHYHPHLEASHRHSRSATTGSVPVSHYDHGVSNSNELARWFGFEALRNTLNYHGRNMDGSNNGSLTNVGSNGPGSGGNNKSHTGNGPWQDRMGASLNTMGPPPIPIVPRPITNCSMKKGFWVSKHNRSGSSTHDTPVRGSSNEAYSSDSGFSSRSPTPSSQQVSPGSGKSNSNNEDDSASAAGEPAPSKPSGGVNKSSKRQEFVPNYFQPFYPHNSQFIGQRGGVHQNCSPHFHNHHRHHHQQQHQHHQANIPGFHHHNHHLSNPPPQRRSESLTSLDQQGIQGNNQSKRRFQSNRHSPPATFRSNNRGRRVPQGTVTHSTTGFSAPDRFLQRSHLMYITSKPNHLVTGSDWDEVSITIWDKFAQNQQTEDMYRNKMELWKKLFYHIKGFYPRYGLFLVGSTISGFGSNKSDMDMCLLVRHSEMDQRIEAVEHLERVLKCLRQCCFIRNADLIQAKVPILKFKDAEHGLEVDLNCNNAVGIRNTHLLFCYAQMDWRVRPLVLVVKLWATSQGINDAKNMTISSYSLVLMVINFLQCGVSPSVLPCLHKLHPSKFQPHTDLHFIDLHEELQPIKSENKQPLGELLSAFLEYYANFDYAQDAVSVRTGSRLLIEECRHARSFKNDPHQWKYLCIEEPFDLTNTAHSVYDPEAFEKIKAAFSSSYEALSESRNLNSIFTSPEKNEDK